MDPLTVPICGTNTKQLMPKRRGPLRLSYGLVIGYVHMDRSSCRKMRSCSSQFSSLDVYGIYNR